MIEFGLEYPELLGFSRDDRLLLWLDKWPLLGERGVFIVVKRGGGLPIENACTSAFIQHAMCFDRT